MDRLQKDYIVAELRQRGIDVLVEELDQLKEELMPFAKARLQQKQEEGIADGEKEYLEAMKEYFGI